MYIFDLKHSDEFQNIILEKLRSIGVNHGIKKLTLNNKSSSQKQSSDKVFRRHLHQICKGSTISKTGSTLEVPSFVVEACNHISNNMFIEGLFRKAGSNLRQKEIKAIVDCGKKLSSQHHVIDVANILKLFFRELPDPLIPYGYHDLFVRCLLLKDNQTEAVLLSCLLLPHLHLTTLVYFMEFVHRVSTYAESNKMDCHNLAIILTPSLMPVQDKLAAAMGLRLNLHVQVIEILIVNHEKIGAIPDDISEKFMSSCSRVSDESINNADTQIKKKKKRRSGSLTRMLNGLKKMVGKGSPDAEESNLITSTPDFTATPCVKSSKKRKVFESGSAFSNKKKRQVLHALPQATPLATPTYCDGYLTPRVCPHPDPLPRPKTPSSCNWKSRKILPSVGPSVNCKNAGNLTEGKKSKRLSLRYRKKPKNGDETSLCSEASSQSDSASLRTSVESRGRRSNRSSEELLSSVETSTDILHNLHLEEANVDLSSQSSLNIENSNSFESDFVKIPKSEYEEIKNRVSAIENRISQEFNCFKKIGVNVDPLESMDSELNPNVEAVQSEYEKVLEESEKIDVGNTDQLAKRLSRELKIRRSIENKIIRSPSARKIGTIRRRSREGREVSRNKSWHVGNRRGEPFACSLRRGKPNTIYSGLPKPSPIRVLSVEEDKSRIQLTFGCAINPSASSDDVNCGNKGHEYIDGGNQSHAKIIRTGSLNSPYLRSHGTKTKKSMSDIQKSELDITSNSEFQIQKVTNYDSNNIEECIVNLISKPVTRSVVRRASSFHGKGHTCNNQDAIKKCQSCESIGLNNNNLCGKFNQPEKRIVPKELEWKSGCEFFKTRQEQAPVTGRESIVKLRSENAGLVQQRLRLFDAHSQDSAFSQKLNVSKKDVLAKQVVKNVKCSSGKKLGSPRKKNQHKSPKDMKGKSGSSTEKFKFEDRKVRKHSSCIVPVSKSHVPARRSSSVKYFRQEKENIGTSKDLELTKYQSAQTKRVTFSPSVEILKCLSDYTDKSCVSVSPLRVHNKIESDFCNKTPRNTPYMKKQLLSCSPSQINRIKMSGGERNPRTPMRAIHIETPLAANKRQSPRLLLMKTRQTRHLT